MATIVRQLATGGFDHNFSYLVHDQATGAAALLDPCGDLAVIRQAICEVRNLLPSYVLLTHGHRDHRDAWPTVREFFPAPLAAHPACPVRPDLALADHQFLTLGDSRLECRHAPGHSPDGVLYRLGDQALFTGDTLFIDCCGYGAAETMFRTMRDVIWPLPDTLEVYSGHDYGRAPHAPLGEEKQRNPYLAATTLSEFRTRLREL